MSDIAILGYGTVGKGVFETININAGEINKKTGLNIKVKKILDLLDFPEDPAKDLITHNFDEILFDNNIDVIAEAMGGLNPAYEFTKSALLKGKSVVTSNKELVAKHGAELSAIAKENNVSYLFEASVGGGIPIIRPISNALTADKIISISGILNGTTNYILSQMAGNGIGYGDALEEAQKLGYAERNPEADIEGYDACRKIAILLSLATGYKIDYSDIYTEGITGITVMDIDIAKKYNYLIKLMASGKIETDGIAAYVSPVLVAQGSPMSAVNGVFNAIMIKGNILGDVMFYGSGAGKFPTASAVVADIIDAVKHKGACITQAWAAQKQCLKPFGEMVCKKLITVSYDGKIDALGGIRQVFGNSAYSSSIFPEGYENIIAFITDDTQEKIISDKIGELIKCPGIKSVLNSIRIYDYE